MKIVTYSIATLVLALFTIVSLASNVGTTAHSFASPLLPSLAPMIKQVEPAVVNIEAEGKIEVPTLALRPGEGGEPSIAPGAPVKRDFQKLGSGVIIDPHQGYILTNAHVIKDAKKITVRFSNGTSTQAKLIGADELSDIAVLQVDGMKLTAISLADSDQLQVGDFVAAIGSPFGLNKTVTFGIVSALGRDGLQLEGFENFIQTDAAINPGNSGGALIDMQGRLVGINTAILAPAGGNIGIGFAIPTNMARSITEQLIKFGEVSRGVLGLYAQPLTQDLATAMNISFVDGVVVTAVNPNSAAAEAGAKVGDVITEINGKSVKDPFQLHNVLGLLRVNTTIKMKILRAGKTIYLSTRLTAAKEQQAAAEKIDPFLSGVRLAVVNQTVGNTAGDTVQVINVNPESLAWQAGLRPGDLILTANMVAVHSITDLNKASQRYKDRLLLNIMRGEGAMFIVIH